MSENNKPTWGCYWLKPDKVMVGEYPSSRSLANTEEKLRQFLTAGFSFFLDLTEEGEMQPYHNALMKEAEKLGKKVEYVKLPVKDIGIPSRDYMKKILDTIDHATANNHIVYVHCRGGIGRTAVVAGCYLVRHGMSGEQAIDALRRMLHEIAPDEDPTHAPGTYEQQYFIRDWKEKEDPVEEPSVIEESPSVRLNRYIGCLIGLAIGDALGVAVESLPVGRFKPIDDILGGGKFNLKAGEWTDDTAMALCIAASLIENNGFNIQDQLQRLINWRDTGYLSCTGRCVGLEFSMERALKIFEKTGKTTAGYYDSYSADNLSLVRMAPIAMAYRKKPEEAIKFSAINSQSTHGSRTATDACRYFTGVLIGALNGLNKRILVSEFYSPVPDLWKKEPLQPAIEVVASGSFRRRYPPTIKNTSYVVDSLEAALWAFYRSPNFKDGALMVVNLGDDAETVGAIYGQLAGAFYGFDGIPKEWVEKIAMRDKIEEIATQLFKMSDQIK